MKTTIDLEHSPKQGRRPMNFRYEPESKPLDGFTIKRAIQRGGFGEVYYALSDAGKEVALKLLQDNMDVELRGIAQCLNLKHPNLLSIFDVKTNAAGEHWVVMEYVSGQALDGLIADNPKGLPPEQVERLLNGIAGGVGYLHDKGIVHRDIKPANIFLEEDTIKVGDVGLAKFISESRRSAQTQSVGTVYYMAPEIAHGRYGHEVDVYGVAVMLFEMLTGNVPFDGESTGEVLMKQLSQPPDLSCLPERLKPVLARGLEKDPLKRTPSVATLAKEFSAALANVKDEYKAFQQGAPVAAAAAAPYPATFTQQQPGTFTREQQYDDVEFVDRPQRPRQARRLSSGEREQIVRAATPVATFLEQPSNWLLIIGLGFAAMFILPALLFGGGIPLVFLIVLGTFGAGAFFVVRAIYRAFFIDADERYGELRDDGKRQPRRATRLNSFYVRNYSPEAERSLSVLEQGAESTGSMAVAALCAGLMAVALWGIDAPFLNTPAKAALFGLVATLGSWAAILPSKFFEGRGGNGVSRRLTTGVLGMMVGAGAFMVDDTLMVDLLPVHDYGQLSRYVADHNLISMVTTSEDAERLVGYVTFFGILMLVRRWWFHVDSYRPARLRVMSVFWTMAAAWVLSLIGKFPYDWAVAWAGAMSVSAQLAAVWVSPEHRPGEMSDDAAATA
jgi:hypothetical protein